MFLRYQCESCIIDKTEHTLLMCTAIFDINILLLRFILPDRKFKFLLVRINKTIYFLFRHSFDKDLNNMFQDRVRMKTIIRNAKMRQLMN